MAPRRQSDSVVCTLPTNHLSLITDHPDLSPTHIDHSATIVNIDDGGSPPTHTPFTQRWNASRVAFESRTGSYTEAGRPRRFRHYEAYGDRCRRSPIWDYFRFDRQLNRSHCRSVACGYTVRGPFTTTLTRHLKSRHPDQYALLIAQRRDMLVDGKTKGGTDATRLGLQNTNTRKKNVEPTVSSTFDAKGVHEDTAQLSTPENADFHSQSAQYTASQLGNASYQTKKRLRATRSNTTRGSVPASTTISDHRQFHQDSEFDNIDYGGRRRGLEEMAVTNDDNVDHEGRCGLDESPMTTDQSRRLHAASVSSNAIAYELRRTAEPTEPMFDPRSVSFTSGDRQNDNIDEDVDDEMAHLQRQVQPNVPPIARVSMQDFYDDSLATLKHERDGSEFDRTNQFVPSEHDSTEQVATRDLIDSIVSRDEISSLRKKSNNEKPMPSDKSYYELKYRLMKLRYDNEHLEKQNKLLQNHMLKRAEVVIERLIDKLA